MTRRQQRAQALRRAGFLPGEARAFSKISRKGMQTPYFQRMVRERRSLRANAIQFGWSNARYWREIRARYQARIGITRFDHTTPWELLRWYQEQYPTDDDYIPPWLLKKRKKSERRSLRARQSKRQMYHDWIAGLDKSITKSEGKQKRQFQRQKRNLEAQLAKLE